MKPPSFGAAWPRAEAGPDGTVAAKDYLSGPFVIRDPDRSTAYNEAWDTILPIVSSFTYTIKDPTGATATATGGGGPGCNSGFKAMYISLATSPEL